MITEVDMLVKYSMMTGCAKKVLLIKNAAGRSNIEIYLPSTPRRIVSLVPSQTELFDLGLEKEVQGVTKFCIHPKVGGRKKKKSVEQKI